MVFVDQRCSEINTLKSVTISNEGFTELNGPHKIPFIHPSEGPEDFGGTTTGVCYGDISTNNCPKAAI